MYGKGEGVRNQDAWAGPQKAGCEQVAGYWVTGQIKGEEDNGGTLGRSREVSWCVTVLACHSLVTALTLVMSHL